MKHLTRTELKTLHDALGAYYILIEKGTIVSPNRQQSYSEVVKLQDKIELAMADLINAELLEL